MSAHTGIEWTDATWNPIRGCTRVSEGCRHCYAETVAARFSGPGQPYEGLAKMTSAGPRWTGVVEQVPEHLGDPLRWVRPRRVFVNSMSDLFHDDVPDRYIAAVFGVMMYAKRHTFQVLTKRPERMASLLPTLTALDCHVAAADLIGESAAWRRVYQPADARFPLPNVWLGVSVENQAAADERIPLLLDTPAAVRFLSCEPLLGPVSLDAYLSSPQGCDGGAWNPDCEVCGDRGLGWVIVGGESGRGARPMHPEWARSLRDECDDAEVPFFFKQWGEWSPVGQKVVSFPRCVVSGMVHSFQDAPYPDDTTSIRIGKQRAGRDLDGRTWDEMPAASA